MKKAFLTSVAVLAAAAAIDATASLPDIFAAYRMRIKSFSNVLPLFNDIINANSIL